MDYDVEALDVDLHPTLLIISIKGKKGRGFVPRGKVYHRGNGIEFVCKLRLCLV